MAIQKLTYNPSVLNKCLDLISIIKQVFKRQFFKRGVFIRYYTHQTHPSFLQYYNHPPLGSYSNFWNARLLHWHNDPQFIDIRPFIIEVNDHPLSAVGYYEHNSEPIKILGHLDLIRSIYLRNNCVKIIFPCDKMKRLFEFYFPDPMLKNKFTIVHGLGCSLKINTSLEINKLNSLKSLKFIVICSDFKLKGLDLVIDAWLSLSLNEGVATLTIVCHNIPESYLDKCKNVNSINIIAEAPLSSDLKHHLLSTHQITIAPTHVHGGANIYEALEYGHAIIYTEYHSSVFENVGVEIKMPYYFYSSNFYGIEWKTWSSFYEKLALDKESGVFNEVIKSIANEILSFVENKDKLLVFSKKSVATVEADYSLESRNKMLKKVYTEYL